MHCKVEGENDMRAHPSELLAAPRWEMVLSHVAPWCSFAVARLTGCIMGVCGVQTPRSMGAKRRC